MGENPYGYDKAYIFYSKDCRKVKILHHDINGVRDVREVVRRREVPEVKIHGDEKESQDKPGDIDPVHVIPGADGDGDMSGKFDMDR